MFHVRTYLAELQQTRHAVAGSPTRRSVVGPQQNQENQQVASATSIAEGDSRIRAEVLTRTKSLVESCEHERNRCVR